MFQPDLIMTVTFDKKPVPTKEWCIATIKKHILAEMQEQAGESFAAVIASTRDKKANRFHFHILIDGVEFEELDRRKLWYKAHRRIGHTRIEPFDDIRPGAFYVAENGLARYGDLDFVGSLWHAGEKRAFEHEVRRITKILSAPWANHRWPTSAPWVKRHQHEKNSLRIFVDGRGGSTNSCYCFFAVNTAEFRVKRCAELTSNQSKYRALRYALLYAPVGSVVEAFSDSDLIVDQFNRRRRARSPKLVALLKRVRKIIRKRRLKVTLSWVTRKRNLARQKFDTTEKNMC
jgi:ribonuclease HI